MKNTKIIEKGEKRKKFTPLAGRGNKFCWGGRGTWKQWISESGRGVKGWSALNSTGGCWRSHDFVMKLMKLAHLKDLFFFYFSFSSLCLQEFSLRLFFLCTCGVQTCADVCMCAKTVKCVYWLKQYVDLSIKLPTAGSLISNWNEWIFLLKLGGNLLGFQDLKGSQHTMKFRIDKHTQIR